MDVRLRLLETLYHLDLAEEDHAQLVQDVASRYWQSGVPLVLTSARRSSGGRWQIPTFHVKNDPTGGHSARLNSLHEIILDDDMQRMSFIEPFYGDVFDGSNATPRTAERMARHGIQSGYGCYAGTGEGGLVALLVLAPHASIHTAETARWSPISAHLAASWRIRQRVAAGTPLTSLADAAVLPNGSLRSDSRLQRSRSTRDRLRTLVAQREAHRRNSDQLWPELVDGRWTLIDHYEAGGQRVVLAVRNCPLGQRLCVLTKRERDVLSAVRTGQSNKAIALELGIDEATVSRALRAATAKIAAGQADLLQAELPDGVQYRNVFDDGSLVACSVTQRRLSTELSEAEREVVAAALRGLSNRQIAQMRGRAERTIVNQLARAFEKLGVRSRRELRRMYTGIETEHGTSSCNS